MRSLLLSLLLVVLSSSVLQPAEEQIVKFDKALVLGLREDERNRLDAPGVKTCGEYFMLISEKDVAYLVKSGKTYSLRTGDLGTMVIEIDNKVKSPIAKMPTGSAGTQASYVLRVSQKEYDKAKDCLPKLK